MTLIQTLVSDTFEVISHVLVLFTSGHDFMKSFCCCNEILIFIWGMSYQTVGNKNRLCGEEIKHIPVLILFPSIVFFSFYSWVALYHPAVLPTPQSLPL